jgi:undecaprenyl-diphosphatase
LFFHGKVFFVLETGVYMNYFIEILKAIVFGIVEGITEWLPVSSTGHMIILGQFFGFESTQGKAFYDFFLVIIQLGAILAVVLSFIKELWPFGKKKSSKQKKEIWMTWAKILVASIPAGIIGILFDDLLDQYLYNYVTVSVTLIVYGVVFLAIEFLLKRKAMKIKERYHLNREIGTAMNDDVSEDSMTNYPVFHIKSIRDISIQYAMIIGLAQCLALIPGTSRSGVTICAALLLSIDRRTAAKFSFYLSIPAMLGGSLIKGALYGMKVAQGKAEGINGFQIGLILISMAVAFAVSLLVINFFMKMLRTRTFNIFGIYRILLGIILLIVFFTVNKGQISTVSCVVPYSDVVLTDLSLCSCHPTVLSL